MDRANYKRLGDYIRQVDVRNKDMAVTNLLGVSVDKKMFPSIANTIGTDFSAYKVISPNQFVYIADTSRRGDKIAFALYKGEDFAIVSSAYTTFEIIDQEKLLPDYLMMWALRPEFDRYARFKSNGSAREIFSWDEMCEVRLPVPDIATQRKIVAEYQAVENRIAANKNLISKLEATAQAIYKKMFVDDIDPEHLPEGWRMGRMADLFELQRGFDLPRQDRISGSIPVYASTGITSYHKESKVKAPGVITGRSGSIGDVFYSNVDFWPLNTTLWVKDFKQSAPMFVYYKLKNTNLETLVGGSSAVPTLNRNDINILSTLIPPCEIMREFEESCSIIEGNKEIVVKENETLSRLLSLLLAKIIQ